MSLGIYVHIPFCKAKCLYCDFNSYAGMEKLQSRYLQALYMEFKQTNHNEKVNSLYIGGGTPTVLQAEDLCEILSKIRENFMLTADCEVTVECNPKTMSYEGFRMLKKNGYNRLSIGVQATDDAILAGLGRIHTFSDCINCFTDARRAGFHNISLDLMYGLPKQTMEMWKQTLKTILALQPEHISCYGLKVEEGTPLASLNPILPDDDTIRDFYEECVFTLKTAGYQRYEISNFAKPGKESRHNCKYWNCEDFIGFGAGAYSCLNACRYDNIRDVSAYCSRLEAGESPVVERIALSKEDKMSEFCFLGLRMENGISQKEFLNRFGVDIAEVYGDVIEKNLRRGTLLRLDDRLSIAPQFFYVSNSILVDFI